MIKVRPAITDEAPEIASLLGELGYRSDETLLRIRLSEIKQRKGEVFVAVDESGDLLGCVHVFIDLRLAEGETGEIVSLVVKNGSRGQGIGKELLNEAKKWIWNSGCNTIRIRANSVREQAHKFYRKQGFHEIKTQKVWQCILS